MDCIACQAHSCCYDGRGLAGRLGNALAAEYSTRACRAWSGVKCTRYRRNLRQNLPSKHGSRASYRAFAESGSLPRLPAHCPSCFLPWSSPSRAHYKHSPHLALLLTHWCVTADREALLILRTLCASTHPRTEPPSFCVLAGTSNKSSTTAAHQLHH